jgi:hypothetical protein
MKHVEAMIDELLEILNALPASEVRILLHHARRLKGTWRDNKCERIFRD